MSSSRNPRERRFRAALRDAGALSVVLGGLCVLTVAAAAALPPITAGTPGPGAGAAAPVLAGAAPTPAALTPPPPDAGPAPRRWTPGQAQLGVVVYWAADPTDTEAQVQEKIRATVATVVGLGANAVSVSFPFTTESPSAGQVRADPALTPTPERLASLVGRAREAGLYVNLRPVLDETALSASDSRSWRGNIRPDDVPAWFASYQRLLAPYATMARATGADSFTVGTELTSMERYTAQWTRLVAGLRTRYGGPLTYSLNWDRLAPGLPRVPDVQLGVDAYFPLRLGDDATVDDVAAAWDDELDTYSEGPLPDLVLSEVGITARAGAYRAPFAWHDQGTPNEAVQATWFAAACRVARQRRVAGLYWWYVKLDTIGRPDDDAMRFADRPAGDVVRRCFAEYPQP